MSYGYTGRLSSQPTADHAIGSQRQPMRLPMGLGDDCHKYPCRSGIDYPDTEAERDKRNNRAKQRAHTAKCRAKKAGME